MTDNTRVSYQQLFTSLLEAVPCPILVVDRALCIHYYNHPAQNFFAPTTITRDLPLGSVIPQESPLQFIRESVETGSPQQKIFDLQKSDLSWSIRVAPLQHRREKGHAPQEKDELDQRRYFTVTIEDKGEIRRMERVQRDFLANISHELRTPLSSVRLLAETLEDTIDTNPEKAQEFVEKIEIEVRYLSSIVAEILDLSSIESGQMPLSIEPVEAQQLVREVMARMFTLSQRHRIRLTTSIHQGKTEVAADSKLIMRVLINLVHNAIKFTPSDGTIVIGTVQQADQRMQQFFVRDTGVGIRAEELPRIFERFYKTDRARARADFTGTGGGGTGLGLAIARHVVEAHGGRIWAESVIEKGSSFTFTLPVVVRNKE